MTETKAFERILPDSAWAVFALLVVGAALFAAMATSEAELAPALVALCSAAIMALVVTPRWPAVALCTFVLLAYGQFRYGESFRTILGLNLLNWVAALALFGWLIALLRTRTRPKSASWLALAMLTFVFWAGVTIIAAWMRGDTLNYYQWHHPAQYVQALVLFLIAAHTLDERITAWWFGLTLSILPALQILEVGYRGIYLDNDLPLLSAMIFPVACLGAAFAHHWALRVLFALAGVNMLVVIAYAQNRGAAVGLAFGLIMLWWNSRYRMRWLLVGVPVVLVAIALLTPRAYVDRFRVLWDGQASHSTAGLDRSTMQSRINLWDAAMRMAADHPIFGVGASRFSRGAEEYLTEKSRKPAHSSVLQVAAEMGLPGVTLYLLLFVGALFVLQKTIRHAGTQWPAPAARAVQAALVVYLVGGCFMSRQDMQLAYLLLGWAAAMQLQRVREPAREPTPRERERERSATAAGSLRERSKREEILEKTR